MQYKLCNLTLCDFDFVQKRNELKSDTIMSVRTPVFAENIEIKI